jgi:hypothetical protein
MDEWLMWYRLQATERELGEFIRDAQIFYQQMLAGTHCSMLYHVYGINYITL